MGVNWFDIIVLTKGVLTGLYYSTYQRRGGVGVNWLYYSTYQRRGGVGVNWFDIIVLTKEGEG